MNLSEILSESLYSFVLSHCKQEPSCRWFFGFECDDTGEFSKPLFAEKDNLPDLQNVDLLLVYLPDAADVHKQAQELFKEGEAVRMVFIDGNADLLEEEQYHALDDEDINAVFAEQGILKKHFDSYTPRSGQIAMAHRVTEVLNYGGVAQIEAGTGVGKSFAYLVPAVYFAVLNETRILIATASIPLQQQLLTKDIPTILAALQSRVKVALVKGMQNYLCVDKLSEDPDLFDDDSIVQLHDWAMHTETGDRSDIPFALADNDWGRLAADPDHCSTSHCPHQDRCFLKRVRERAKQAQILIGNHHLMLIDRDIRQQSKGAVGVIPRYSHLIVDEAHKLSEIASAVYSKKFSSQMILRNARRICNTSKRHLLARLFAYCSGESKDHKKENEYTEKILALVQQLDTATREFDVCMEREIAESEYTVSNATMKELPANAFSGKNNYKAVCENVCITLDALVATVKSVQDYAEERALDAEHVRYRLMRSVNRLEEIQSFFARLLTGEFPETVAWFVQQENLRIQLWSIPLELGDLFLEKFLEPLRSLVFTSATLEENEAIHTWQRFLSPDEKQVYHVASSFHYEDQQLLAVPTDAPPVKGDPARYVEYLAELIGELAPISKGAMLVLFTSYSMLRSCYAMLEKKNITDAFTVLQQGSLSREHLLKRFMQEASSILLGTNSFWEGIDIPGKSLQMLILTRLPFKVPSGVYAQAREAYIRSQGKEPFVAEAIPVAVQKLRQGVGRLIRSEYDHGAVIVTDTRVLRWEKAFLGALPPSQRSYNPSSDMLNDIRQFFSQFS